MVMPRSRSRSMESRTCSIISRCESAPVTSSSRSARVDSAVVDVRNDREIPDEFAIHVVGDWPEFQLSHMAHPKHLYRSSPTCYHQS